MYVHKYSYLDIIKSVIKGNDSLEIFYETLLGILFMYNSNYNFLAK